MGRIRPLVALALAVSVVTAPSAAADPAPGSVITVQQLAGAGAPGTTASSVTYWTRDSLGHPRQALATIYLPTAAAPAGGWPILAWAHGTAGLGDGCAVTAKYGSMSGYSTIVQKWTAAGFAFVATEYIGLGTEGDHPYLDAAAAAHAVLDSVRAARSVEPSLSAKVVVNGGSQGGHAALATGAAAHEYAPERTLLGAIADAPATQIDRYIPLAGPYVPPLPAPDYTTYVAYILAGVEAARPDFDLNPYLTPLGRAVINDAKTLCYAPMNIRTHGISVGALLAKPLLVGDFPAVLREVTDFPVAGYDAPVLVNQGRLDITAFPFLTDLQVTAMRVHGTSVTYRQFLAGHDLWSYTIDGNIAWARAHLS